MFIDFPQRLRHFKGNEPAPIFVKEWYQNGQLGFEMIFKKPITFVKRWNEEGNLYNEHESKQIEIQGVNRSQNIKDTYYYPNGQIAKHTEGYEETKYFDKDGNSSFALPLILKEKDWNLYENICKGIKQVVPEIHIHGFSPEEILYGATRSNISPKEYLIRLKEAGVDTIPGTAAEILNQELRDKISPGRINVSEWVDIIKTAHKMGIKSTSTIMFGHLETNEQKANHIAKIREIQKETGGFTEFVPLNFKT